MSICAVSLPFPGVIRVLEEGVKFNLWDLVTLDRELVRIPQADVYILGAYHRAYDQIVEQLSGKICVLWTSSSGEVNLEPVEQVLLKQVVEDDRIDSIWFGDLGLASVIDKGFCAPYPIVYEEFEIQEKDNIVTLFQPMTLKKNLYTQLCAIKLLQQDHDLTLHTNVDLEKLSLPFELNAVQHGWLERSTLSEIIARSKLNFGVSFAETFGYNIAEATMLGCVSVVSPAISWAPLDCQVSYANSAIYIAQTAEYLLKHSDIMIKPFRSALYKYARMSDFLAQTLRDKIPV
jgi:hypothetical protein